MKTPILSLSLVAAAVAAVAVAPGGSTGDACTFATEPDCPGTACLDAIDPRLGFCVRRLYEPCDYIQCDAIPPDPCDLVDCYWPPAP